MVTEPEQKAVFLGHAVETPVVITDVFRQAQELHHTPAAHGSGQTAGLPKRPPDGNRKRATEIVT